MHWLARQGQRPCRLMLGCSPCQPANVQALHTQPIIHIAYPALHCDHHQPCCGKRQNFLLQCASSALSRNYVPLGRQGCSRLRCMPPSEGTFAVRRRRRACWFSVGMLLLLLRLSKLLLYNLPHIHQTRLHPCVALAASAFA